METLKLVKNNEGCYQQESESKNEVCQIIYNVLADGGIDFDFLLEWIQNTRFSTLQSSLCAFVKTGSNVIITRQHLSKKEFCPYCNISQTNFINLINQWKKINKEKPLEVFISQAEGDISVECGC